MRILFALSGLHRFNRGAEIAFESVATELAKSGNAVTLIGSGRPREAAPYRFLRAGSIRRENFERFPSLPFFRDECGYEELTFVPGLMRRYHPADYDVTLSCAYPFTNWLLRRATVSRRRPAHVFVTQNGDWPAIAGNSEFRFFGCDGLVCTNPVFYERNKDRWSCKLIPNGVDCDVFFPGPSQREEFGLPPDRLVVLMVSALISTKRVDVGIKAVSKIPGAHLVVAGDGPMRQAVEADAERLLPGRFTRLSVSSEKMPFLYRSANIFLHLSKDEPSSLAFLEAMASGLPVVAHDAPQLRWIAGDDEYLLDTENSIDVAREIEHAAAEASPVLQQRRLSKMQDFGWRVLAKKYSEFLQEVVENM
jgi:glycosyltransferase involved in cell wall biosynthesis